MWCVCVLIFWWWLVCAVIWIHDPGGSDSTHRDGECSVWGATARWHHVYPTLSLMHASAHPHTHIWPHQQSEGMVLSLSTCQFRIALACCETSVKLITLCWFEGCEITLNFRALIDSPRSCIAERNMTSIHTVNCVVVSYLFICGAQHTMQYQYDFKNILTTGHVYSSDVVPLPSCPLFSLKVATLMWFINQNLTRGPVLYIYCTFEIFVLGFFFMIASLFLAHLLLKDNGGGLVICAEGCWGCHIGREYEALCSTLRILLGNVIL